MPAAHEQRAVLREAQTSYGIRVRRENSKHFAPLDVPQPDRLIVRARREEIAHGRVGECEDERGVPFQDDTCSPAAIACVTPAVLRFELPILRMNRHILISIRIMPGSRAIIDAPQPNELVVPRTRDGSSIRREDNVVDALGPDGSAVRIGLLALSNELGWRWRNGKRSKEGRS